MAEPKFCELCGVLTPEPQVVSGKFYCPKCVLRLESGVSGSGVEDAPLRNSVPGAPPEKMKFRCLGCDALLSVKPVSQKAKLTCPQCKTQMYIEPDGSVEPVHKTAQPGSRKAEAHGAPPAFDKEELDKMLDMGMGRDGRPDETVDTPSGRPSGERTDLVPSTRAVGRPRKQPPRLKIQPRSKLERYKKIAAGLPAAEENRVLLIIAVVLLALPAIFALIVIYSDVGATLKAKFESPAETLREGVKKLMLTVTTPIEGRGASEKAVKEEKPKEAEESETPEGAEVKPDTERDNSKPTESETKEMKSK